MPIAVLLFALMAGVQEWLTRALILSLSKDAVFASPAVSSSP
jgi:hypothetical protein